MPGLVGCKRAFFHPQDLTRSVLVGWFAAEDLANGAVATWTDRISGAATTAAGSAQPTKAATSFNSAYPGVTFDGVANCMVNTSFAAFPTGAVAGEIWMVATNSNPSTTGGVILGYGNNNASLARQTGIGASGQMPQVTDRSVFEIGLAAWNAPAIVKGDWSGTTMNGYQNGTPFSGNPATISALNTSTTRLRIGAGIATAAAAFWQGPIADILILRGVLSNALRQKVEGYFAWKYGLQSLLPQTHPYKLFQP